MGSVLRWNGSCRSCINLQSCKALSPFTHTHDRARVPNICAKSTGGSDESSARTVVMPFSVPVPSAPRLRLKYYCTKIRRFIRNANRHGFTSVAGTCRISGVFLCSLKPRSVEYVTFRSFYKPARLSALPVCFNSRTSAFVPVPFRFHTLSAFG